MARCSNCNAPLPDGSPKCGYCGERNDIDLRGIHYYTTHHSDEPRICPRCNVPLKTIDLKLNGTFLIERCEQCFGLFFDPAELEALLDAAVSNVYQIDRSGMDSINFHRPADEYPVAYIKCPVCTQLMHRVNFGAKSGVIIDRCKNHGVWLDGGELRRLMEWMKLGGKLLDQERQEQLKAEEHKRENEQRRNSSGYYDTPDPFASRGDERFSLDPNLISIISDVVRFIARW